MTEEKKISEYLEILSSKAPVSGRRRSIRFSRSTGKCPGTDGSKSDGRKEKYAEVEEEMQNT